MKFRLDDWVSVGTMCLIMALLYLAAFGKYGYSDTDHGFIQGLSWRILQGQIPYIDFIYVRPPLSLYLHMPPLLLPHPVWAERLIFYLFMAVTVWVSTRTIQIHFDFQAIGLSPSIFAIIAFIISVHNFPPEPWHTIDGILFASIGTYSIVVGKPSFKSFIGLTFLLVAALCKQSFYPLPILGIILLWILHGKDITLKVSMYFLLFHAGLLLFIHVMSPALIPAFLSQTAGATEFKDLWQVGVIKYLKPLGMIVIPIILLWRLQNRFIFPGRWRHTPSAICWIIFFSLILLHVLKAIQTESFVPPSFGFSQAMFLIAVGIGIKGTWIHTKAHSILLMLLAISWCSGLSWGYATPQLFFVPILFGFIFGLYDEFEFRVPRYFYGLVATVVMWAFAFLNQYPYRDAPRSEINYHLGDYFPSLGNIYSGEVFYFKMKEFKTLYERYGDPYTVLPALPSAHFYTSSTNPIPIDWAHNAEIQFDKFGELVKKDLEDKEVTVFFEKDKLDRIHEEGKYGSYLSQYVRREWILIEETAHFEVYQFNKQEKGLSIKLLQTGPAPASN